MYFALYLKRSFSRRFQKHFSLYLVLTCAFLLPLLISFYRDSRSYGSMQQLLFLSKGQTFHISNVTEADCQYFQGIEGLSSPFYEDGEIYLKIENDEQWKDFATLNMYGSQVQQRINEMGRSDVFFTGNEYERAHGISTDAVLLSSQRQLYALNVLLILFMAFIVQSTYQSHLQYFSSDMETLSCCGASRRQIASIFLIEFLVVFASSAISAVLISGGILKALFGFFLEMREDSGLAWLVFHVDVQNTAVHLLICFLALGVPLCLSLRKYPRRSVSQASAIPKKYRRKKLTASRSPARTLAKLWRQRTNRVLQNCLCISIPLVTIFLFLFQYLLLNQADLSTPVDYEIRVTSASISFTDEVINDIEAMEDVAYVVAKRVPPPGEFHIEDPEGCLEPVRIHSISDLAAKNEAFGKYDAVIRVNPARMQLEPGGKIKLISFKGQVGEELFALTAKQVLEGEKDDWACDVYIDDVLLTIILNQLPCNEIEIKLRDVSRHEAVGEALQTRFQGLGYKIDDRQTSVSFAQSAAPGYYLLTAYLFVVLFALVGLILYTRLCDYIRGQFEIIKTIHSLGASKGVICQSFLRQAIIPALAAALVPILLSILAMELITRSLGITLHWSSPVLAGYLGVGLLMMGIYLYPIQITLKNYMKRIQLGRQP